MTIDAEALRELRQEAKFVDELAESPAFHWFVTKLAQMADRRGDRVVKAHDEPHVLYRRAGEIEGLRLAASVLSRETNRIRKALNIPRP